MAKFQIQIISLRWLETLQRARARENALLALSGRDEVLSHLVSVSTSQRGQDLIAFIASGGTRQGYFVEIGVGDGIMNSNSLGLERIGWKGLLVEPAREWKNSIESNRTSLLDTRAAHFTDGIEMEFLEAGELSGLREAFKPDGFKRRGKTYRVTTVNATSLLREYDAPSVIDFLSIDTEGSEVEIVQGLDFKRYSFKFICVEHNHMASKRILDDLLSEVGYRRVMSAQSENDAFYVPFGSVLAQSSE